MTARVAFVTVSCFVAALLLGSSGRTHGEPVFLATFFVTAFAFVCAAASRGFRTWLLRVDPRVLIAGHLVRFVGAYFLVLHARGELPASFAWPVGIGDLIGAVGACALLTRRQLFATRSARAWLTAWNAFGLAHLLYAGYAAFEADLRASGAVDVFTRLPLVLLPLFFVPLGLFTHAVLFARLRLTRARV